MNVKTSSNIILFITNIVSFTAIFYLIVNTILKHTILKVLDTIKVRYRIQKVRYRILKELFLRQKTANIKMIQS